MNFSVGGDAPGVAELRSCVDACAAIDGAPACLTPETLKVSFAVPMWIGLHRATPADDFSSLLEIGSASQFTHCLDGSAPNVTVPVVPLSLIHI